MTLIQLKIVIKIPSFKL